MNSLQLNHTKGVVCGTSYLFIHKAPQLSPHPSSRSFLIQPQIFLCSNDDLVGLLTNAEVMLRTQMCEILPKTGLCAPTYIFQLQNFLFLSLYLYLQSHYKSNCAFILSDAYTMLINAKSFHHIHCLTVHHWLISIVVFSFPQ